MVAIGRVRHIAACVSDSCVDYAGQLADQVLHAPEATAGQHGTSTGSRAWFDTGHGPTADEARARFERELANGWEYDEDPPADHLFGAYYHWCALLCGFSEAALDHGLLSASQLDAVRPDIEACLPELRACRQSLVVIPASREEHPRIVDLLRDDETLRLFVVFIAHSVKLSTKSACLESSTFWRLRSGDHLHSPRQCRYGRQRQPRGGFMPHIGETASRTSILNATA